MPITVKKGIHLPDCDLWLDPDRKRGLAAVTHAHSDHAGWHAVTIATPATCSLMAVRRKRTGGTVHELPFHQPHQISGSQVTLLPAGHILGSAQVFLETEGGSLLYTGDFKLRPNLTAENAIVVKADTLIIETTFGLPRYRFPAAQVVTKEIVDFCKTAIEDARTPVLLAYSLGKAQELAARLGGSGLPIALHPSAWEMSRVYAAHGVTFPGCEVFGQSEIDGKVLIWPPNARAALARIPDARTAIVSGWAIDQSAKYRYQCDAAFPLSDHAGYDELIEFVDRVQPRMVFTVHGFTEEFACDLRRRGVEAWALGGGNQMEFGLGA